MNLTVFGGSGATGRIVIGKALETGHEVSAYVRSPHKLTPQANLRIVVGELGDAAVIADAVAGADAVISLLDPSTKKTDGPPVVTGTRHIIAAMDGAGVSRLIALATPSASVPEDGRDLRIGAMIALLKTTQRVAYDTIVAVGAAVMGSGLDWTLVRLALLTNGPETGHVNARYVGDKGGLRLSRANAARFFLDQVDDATWLRKAPFISD